MADDKANFISVYLSVGGWKAVEYWWNPDLGGYWEPWQTGLGGYATRAEAVAEAVSWAKSEGVEARGLGDLP